MDGFLAIAEDVPGPRLLELRDRADVAGAELVDRQQALAEQAPELTDPLLLAAAAVDHLGIGADRASEDPEEVDAPGIGIGERLEDVGDQAIVVRGLDLDHVFPLGQTLQRTAHRRRGQVLDQRREQPVGAEVAGRRAAGDREDRPRRHAALQGGDDLLVLDLIAVEVALHQLVRGLRDLVHQLLAVLLGLFAQLLGDLLLDRAPRPLALVYDRLHVDQVDHAAQIAFAADRDLGGDQVRPELRPHRLDRGEEVSPFAIEHVDEDEAGEPLLVGPAPEPCCAHLEPFDPVDDDDRGVGDAQRGDRVGDEARLAGRVEEVDLTPLVLEAGERDVDRHLPGALVLGVVGEGRAALDAAEPVDRPRLEEDRLVQARLAGAPVPDQSDVADPVCGLMEGTRPRYTRPVLGINPAGGGSSAA